MIYDNKSDSIGSPVGLNKPPPPIGCHTQQRSFKIMIMRMFVTLDKAKPDRKYKRLKLGGGHVYDRSGV
jgi:hypothetical protein